MRHTIKIIKCLLSGMGAFLLLYAEIISSFPSEMLMYLGEAHQKNLGAWVSIADIPKNVCVSTDETTVTPLKEGEYYANLKLGSIIPYKKIRLHITQPASLCASGSLVGLKIYNDGLIVLKTDSIKCSGETEVSPSQKAGIEAGDVIKEINGTPPTESGDVEKLLISGRNVLKLLRGNKEYTVVVYPVEEETSGKLKIGTWVRDSTAGVGTLTYYNPQSLEYGALGHAINDSDTGLMFSVWKGAIEKSRVVSVKKGAMGEPGEICGSFSPMGTIAGTVETNCETGIFGHLSPDSQMEGISYPVGLIGQVRAGDAYILSTVDEGVKKYAVKIIRTMPFSAAAKGLMIKITDEALIEKTGGIVQGMSGSPIIQDGRLVGAVTHVLISNPTVGYGIYIENMLPEGFKLG